MLVSFEYVTAWVVARGRVGDRGANLIEYGLLVALIALVCVLAVTLLGRSVSSKFSSIGSGVSN